MSFWKVRDAERHKPNKLLAPGIIYILLFAVAIVVFAYYVGPSTKDEGRIMSDEMSKNNVVEHDKLDIAIDVRN